MTYSHVVPGIFLERPNRFIARCLINGAKETVHVKNTGRCRELLVPVFQGGELVYEVPDLQASRAYCQRQVDSLWDEVKRFENPHNYYVDLSQKLWDIKQSLLISHEMK